MKFLKKKSFYFLLFIALFSFNNLYGFENPFDNGSFEAKQIKIRKEKKNGLRFNLNVWYPKGKEQSAVLVFVSGLNGFAPTFMYKQLFKKVAEKGVTVVIPEGRILLPNMYKKRAYDVAGVVKWMKESFPKRLTDKTGGKAPLANMNQIILSGHSSGAQSVVVAAKELKNEIGGIFFMDPVDGDPYEMGEKSIKEEDYFSDGTPVLIVSSGLGGQPGFKWKWWPSCAPEGISTFHFYDHFAGPKWHVNTSNFGHIDMLDNYARSFVTFTRFCSGASGKMNFENLRNYISGSILSFVEGALNGNESALKYIEDPSFMNIETVVDSER